MTLCRLNKLEEAKRELQFILKKDSQNFDALDGFGIVLLKMGKYQEGLKYVEKAVLINPKDMMAHVHLAAAYQKLKQSEKAKTAWKKAQSFASNRAEKKRIKQEFKWVVGR